MTQTLREDKFTWKPGDLVFTGFSFPDWIQKLVDAMPTDDVEALKYWQGLLKDGTINGTEFMFILRNLPEGCTTTSD